MYFYDHYSHFNAKNAAAIIREQKTIKLNFSVIWDITVKAQQQETSRCANYEPLRNGNVAILTWNLPLAAVMYK